MAANIHLVPAGVGWAVENGGIGKRILYGEASHMANSPMMLRNFLAGAEG